MKMTVTASYSAVPFMLTVVARGSTNCTTASSRPMSLAQAIATCSTAFGALVRICQLRKTRGDVQHTLQPHTAHLKGLCSNCSCGQGQHNLHHRLIEAHVPGAGHSHLPHSSQRLQQGSASSGSECCRSASGPASQGAGCLVHRPAQQPAHGQLLAGWSSAAAPSLVALYTAGRAPCI